MAQLNSSSPDLVPNKGKGKLVDSVEGNNPADSGRVVGGSVACGTGSMGTVCHMAQGNSGGQHLQILLQMMASTKGVNRESQGDEEGMEVDTGGSNSSGDTGCAFAEGQKGDSKIVGVLCCGTPRYTWCNNQQGRARVWERLDRACAIAGWIQSFPDHHVRHLPRIASDHNPLLVSTEAHIPVRSPFRFEKFWLCYPRSWEMVQEAWSTPVRGDAMYRVSRRLELTRRRLRRWNREEVENIFRRTEEEEEAIDRLQSQEAQRGGLSEEEMGELRSHLALHDSLLRQRDTLWRQKSRIQWILEGDRNTRFFHQATMIRRHQNKIRIIRSEDGQMSEDPDMIRRIMESFFKARWTEPLGGRRRVEMPMPTVRVSEEETDVMIRLVSEEEMKAAVWSLEGDKAPGPNGFPPLIFRRYWMVVGQDITAAIQQFFTTTVMSSDRQRTFITLIPKRQDATDPGHFRPISLCTTLYKATMKILAVKLRDLLPRLISPEQDAFIGGRSISNNVLIAQKFMFDPGRAPMRRSLMRVKLDIERAYDRMRWNFVHQSLQVFGFSETWIQWIMGCVRAPSFAILAVLTQELETYRPVVDAPSISHLLFVDDCQRVNLSKSVVCFSSSTRQEEKNSIMEILGVAEQDGMMRYLGVPLSGRRLRGRDCTFLEASIRQRVEGWQRHSLSMMGRITLVRLVLSSIPTYLLSTSFILVAVLRTIEQLLRSFIRGRQGGRDGIHLLAWEVVCQPTRWGGLRVQSLLERREALAACHVARFVMESNSIWSSLLRAKYGVLILGARAARHHSPVWREMCTRVGAVLPEIRWAVGDGRSIDVLEDCWVTAQPISRLPTMVDSGRLTGCRVSDLMIPDEGRWRVGLVREVFGEQLAEMILALPVPTRGESDRLIWVPSGRSQVRARDLLALFSGELVRQIEKG
ncbi:uncharacterized protein LOC120111970 [Phoenix dactylifera]|uniref:Uncharacterized protein LOC120111970 n=1 Tax=Phoenix dactylifera TaxID=42345 RepID=A0A8B9AR32_PHODC|nr:uncharacterized protein LOC120111970 [Phoenix dactylifera]